MIKAGIDDEGVWGIHKYFYFLSAITSSNDQSLLDILVDMANAKDNNDDEEEINPTPLSETTFINNGKIVHFS